MNRVQQICPVGGVVPSASQAIDLGLPSGTLWAPWNVGAAKATDAGEVFAWGETTVKSVYNWSTYKHVLANQSSKDCISKYTVADGDLQSSWYSGGAFCGDGIGAIGIADGAQRQTGASTGGRRP